jgi:23S rRNA (cytosine1962-C5)-methyltransferase
MQLESVGKVTLRKGRERSLERFHPWVFSGAVGSVDKNVVEGDLVEVVTASGELVGVGHFGPQTIAVKIIEFGRDSIDHELLVARFEEAAALRSQLHLLESNDTDCLRLIHGEADGLPGLIVDLYGTHAVFQCHSVGMAKILPELTLACLNALQGRVKTHSGRLERGVADKVEILKPAEDAVTHALVKEAGLQFEVDFVHGQKTGFFLDQRDNRALVRSFSKDARVLNAFAYSGAFSAFAFAGGATFVRSIDSSKGAIELAEKNVTRNFPAADHDTVVADCMEYLRDHDDQYDLVIIDPPAFAKRRLDADNAFRAYCRLNEMALRVVRPGGLLFTFSCSQAIDRNRFREAILTAACTNRRNAVILAQLTQAPDHPISIFHPEGEYLKGLVIRAS